MASQSIIDVTSALRNVTSVAQVRETISSSLTIDLIYGDNHTDARKKCIAFVLYLYDK